MPAPLTAPLQRLRTFRKNLLGAFPLRRDALFELIDALLLAHDPRSLQELALSPAFRRRWGMVHDALCHGQLDPAQARALLAEAEPPDAMTIAGCAVYGLDSTIAVRPEAETLEDRGHVYSTCAEKAVVGHQYSWLGRLVSRAPAWFSPRDVERIPTVGEAWGAVMDSFRRTSFDRPELLDHPLVSEAIRCMGGLEVIGMSENNMADRAHFLKIFEQLRERAMRETLELPAITEYIESKRLIDGQVKALAVRMGRTPVLIENGSRDHDLLSKSMQPAR